MSNTRPIMPLVTGGIVLVWAASASAVHHIHPPVSPHRISRTRTDLRAVRSAVELYRVLESDASCPSVKDLIRADIFSRHMRVEDAWGGEFVVRCIDDQVEVRSAGADGDFFTEDDVSSGT